MFFMGAFFPFPLCAGGSMFYANGLESRGSPFQDPEQDFESAPGLDG